MPISCAVLADIALSLPVKTLTLPAIETSGGPEQLNGIGEYCHPARLAPDCHQVNARTVRSTLTSSRLVWQKRGNWNDQSLERNPRTRSMGRRLFVVESDTAPDRPRASRDGSPTPAGISQGRCGSGEACDRA